jgi:formate dehydrogenase subunit delta
MSPDKLVYMANQIGKFFASQGPDHAVQGTAEHLKKFWDPRMRADIVSHLDAGGSGLDPVVRRAIEQLREKAPDERMPPPSARPSILHRLLGRRG